MPALNNNHLKFYKGISVVEAKVFPPLRLAVAGATRGLTLVHQNWWPIGAAIPVAVCDLKTDLAKQRVAPIEADGLGPVRIFSNIEDMLEWGQFDAVVVATSDATHYDLGVKVFDAGFHAYIEKPMTTDVDEARDLVQRCERAGKIGMVGHEMRYTAAIVQAKQKIEEGVIGTPRMAMTMDACGRMGSYWRRKEWRTSQKPAGNSLTLQKAIHQLDIQTYLMGSRAASVFASSGQNHFGGTMPSDLTCDVCELADECMYDARKMQVNGIPSVKAAKDRLCVYTDDVDMHDNKIVTIDYQNGSRGSYIECFFTPTYEVQHSIIGDRGRLDVRMFHGNPYQELEVSWIGSQRSERFLCASPGSHGGGDDAMGRVFQKAVREQSQLSPSLVDGFHAVSLVRAIDQSACQRQPQIVENLDEVMARNCSG